MQHLIEVDDIPGQIYEISLDDFWIFNKISTSGTFLKCWQCNSTFELYPCQKCGHDTYRTDSPNWRQWEKIYLRCTRCGFADGYWYCTCSDDSMAFSSTTYQIKKSFSKIFLFYTIIKPFSFILRNIRIIKLKLQGK